MTPASNPYSDHSYELPLRRNLLLLLDLLGLLRFIAGVLLDRLGVVSCQGGGVQLPVLAWPGVNHADDVAMERLLEATLWGASSAATGTRSRTAAPYMRRRRAAQPADDEQDDGEGAAVCAICLATLEEAGGCETVAELGVCSHAFHAACIDAWTGSGAAATCPLCRAPMLSPTAWDDGQSLCHARPGD